jgi:serine/threonine protein kinase
MDEMTTGKPDNAPKEPHVRRLFLEALELPVAGQREAWLAKACGADFELRPEVEALLLSHREDTFLERPPKGVTSLLPSPPNATAPEQPGVFIDRYKLLQQIGEGGCGVVYLAEQEQPIQRRVAIKVIKSGMDTRRVIARFEAERQALALMDHPNIARVLDAGATQAGRPFFVMELMRGTKITEYCDQCQLPAKERLRLFVQVCQAVQHAHQKGIIHRDLKPSNILVTVNDGVPVAASGYFAGGSIYTSSDSGASWRATTAPTNTYWSSVASSADGTRLFAMGEQDNGYGTIYCSLDSGATWLPRSAPGNGWFAFACSSDGTRLAAAAFEQYLGNEPAGRIYLSTDSGTNWTLSGSPEDFWVSVASSGDGTQLVATDGSARVYISTDSGSTWSLSSAPAGAGGNATISADGSNVVVYGYVAATRHAPPPKPPSPASPVLSMARSGAYSLLSWLVPSTPLTLQQTTDLSSPSWIDVTNQPTLNFTNLHSGLTLLPTNRTAFYRLKRQ